MAILDVLDLGSHVSFDVYPAAVIGTTFNNVEVAAILDFDTAMMFDDVAAMHANVFPTLPGGTINDPRKYLYGKFRLENSNIVVIGLPWIKLDTVVTNSSVNMTFTVLAVNPVDQARAKEVMAANGFNITNVILS